MVVLETHRNRRDAALSRIAFVEAQKLVDRIRERLGEKVEPPANDVYVVRWRGSRWVVGYTDPSLR